MTEKPMSRESELTLLRLVQLGVGSWKILLVVGLAAGVLAATVLNWVPPTYEASSTILVTRTRAKDQMVGVDTTAIEIDSFAAALESEDVLEEVMTTHNLNVPPYEFSLERFDDAVSIYPLRNEDSIRINVELPAENEDTPKLVAEVANAFAKQADEISIRLLEEDIERSLTFYRTQYEESRERLNDIQKEALRIRSTAPIEQKTRYINNQERLQSQLQTSLALALADLLQKEEKLKVLRELLDEEEPLLTVNRMLEEEPGMLEVLSARTGRSATEIYSATSSSQIINDVYIKLREFADETASDVAGLRRVVEELPPHIEECNLNISAAEKILNASQTLIEHSSHLVETAHLGFREVYKKLELATLSIVSDRQDLIGEWIRAYPPNKVSGVPKPVLIASSAVLAMGVFLVLIFVAEVVRVSLKP